MKRLLPLLLLVATRFAGLSAQPLCRITHFDDFGGLSQRLVMAVAQDGQGMMWLATWNGLNRYDGYEFVTVKPHVGDGSGIYSDRVNDIRTSAGGLLWLRIDNRCVLFDPRNYRFIDVHRLLDERLGKGTALAHIRPARDSTTVVELADGRFIVFSDRYAAAEDSRRAIVSVERSLPARPYFKLQNKGIPSQEYSNDAAVKAAQSAVIYAGRAADSTRWLVMQNGRIFRRAAGSNAFVPDEARIDIPEKLYFATTDRQGNVWLRSAYGAYKLQFGAYPFRRFLPEGGAQVRCLYQDRSGRTWAATKDDGMVRILDRRLAPAAFLSPDGKLSKTPVAFGHAVYCMLEDSKGRLWLGTKPDGLFCLQNSTLTQYKHRAGDSRSLSDDNVYDLAEDARGRIWVATNGGGLNCLDETDGTMRFVHAANGLNGYPAEAVGVRRLCITRGGMLLAATTNGLLAADITSTNPADIVFHRHTGEAGRANSLSNVALMDVIEDARGRIFLATESGGVNMVESTQLLSSRPAFRHFDASEGFPTDVALSFATDGRDLWVTGNNCLVRLDVPDGASASAASAPFTTAVYGASFFRRPLRFSEAHPLVLPDGRFLVGLTDGGIALSPETMQPSHDVPPIAITAVKIQDRADALAVNSADTLVLLPPERSITVSFAALDYTAADLISYAYRLDEADTTWHRLGHNRSVSFLDMEPGTYRLQIRSTDSRGEWLDNVRTITIIVKPRFVETAWFKLLIALLVALIVAAVVRTYLYIKAIRRKQAETLERYLQLIQQSQSVPDAPATSPETSSPEASPAAAGTPSPAAAPPKEVRKAPELSEQDAAFMKRVSAFVEQNIGNADVNIQDMADAAAVSRSGLNRKMKSLLGITPADFLRRNRIRRACRLLVETNRSVTDIALSCGFADQNYFSKAFRAQTGTSPSAYRLSNRETEEPEN